MRVRFFVYILMLLLFVQNHLMAEEINFIPAAAGLSKLTVLRSAPMLYRPNKLFTGQDAVFKVKAAPDSFVVLVLDYEFEPQSVAYESKTNAAGLCTFRIPMNVAKEYVGRTVKVEAMVWKNEDKSDIVKAQPLDSTGNTAASARIVISDGGAKGVVFSPSRGLNEYIINSDYDEDSNFDLSKNKIYNDSTPAYVKNMRDAQDNVKQKTP
ncbi:MAG: hypothetical protein PHX18_07905 [Candidatus Gastranaerophilales bacterium]|nr:hypothetical protein [Candidatus Gastranaerophilales bacterium]